MQEINEGKGEFPGSSATLYLTGLKLCLAFGRRDGVHKLEVVSWGTLVLNFSSKRKVHPT